MVLKIAGDGHGVEKIQNEVGCYLLLEKYCPEIPAPKLLAWCDSGRKIRTPEYARGFRGNEIKSPPLLAMDNDDHVLLGAAKDAESRGWMLLTCVPGRPPTKEILTGPAQDEIHRQIGHYVAMWRNNLPTAHTIGNFRIHSNTSHPEPAAVLYDKDILPGYGLYLNGLLNAPKTLALLDTAQKYYTFMLDSQLEKLKDENSLHQRSNEVYEVVKAFRDNFLPRLSLFNAPEIFIFAHTDLAPRNVHIVSAVGGSYTVCGIFDFEFSGFYPQHHEFAEHMQNSLEEWPIEGFQVLLSELRRNAALPAGLVEKIPPKSAVGGIVGDDKVWVFGGNEFHQAALLRRLTINLVPFWASSEDNEAVEAAVERVVAAVAWLRGLLGSERVARRRSEHNGSIRNR
jgi:hypothetical protein